MRFDGHRLNYCDQNCDFDWKDDNVDDGYRFTAPIGTYPTGASWVGAFDLSGNVWEWTQSTYDQEKYPYPYNPDDGREQLDIINDTRKVLRGGSWSRSGVDTRGGQSRQPQCR